MVRIELSPAGKAIALILLIAVAAGVVVTQGPDARRYLKMESM